MAAQLSDDGTMDTIIRCSECGEEQRYNYDGDTEEECAPLCASRVPFGECTCGRAERSYDAFVDWCLEDFESEHVCDTK